MTTRGPNRCWSPARMPPRRDLAELTYVEVASLDKEGGLVVLPLGSTEQHGPHLPLATDALLADRLLDAALALLPEQVRVWRLPTLPYGKSNEHTGFAGTLTLSHQTLAGVLHDVARGVTEAGFTRLALFSGHGGNTPTLDVVARDVRANTGLLCLVIDPGIQFSAVTGLSERERDLGYHAGQVETSLMLALAPELVRMERAVAEFPPASPSRIGLAGPARKAWLTSDVSKSGVLGDATIADAAQGERMLNEIARAIAMVLVAMAEEPAGAAVGAPAPGVGSL